MNAKDPKSRFSDRVGSYKKYRPGYPREIISFIQQAYPVDAAWSVADIGSGTGISTQLLISGLQCPVYAVEPNEKMRNDAEMSFQGDPLFRSIDGSAEETTLGSASVNMIAVFQAFHWFEKEKTRKEFTRVLKEPKAVLIVWNDRVTMGTAFLEGYEAVL